MTSETTPTTSRFTTTTAAVEGVTVTRPPAVVTTTTRPAPTTTTTVKKTTVTTKPKTTTTTRPKTTGTTGFDTVDCGAIETHVFLGWDGDGTRPPAKNYVTVTNTDTGSGAPTVHIDKVIVHLDYGDGTTSDVEVTSARDATVAPGATSPHFSFDPGARATAQQPVTHTDWHAEGVSACPAQKG